MADESNCYGTGIADDIVRGVPKIASIVGLTERKCYYALEAGFLPGCWKEGRGWVGLKSEILGAYRARARAGLSKREVA